MNREQGVHGIRQMSRGGGESGQVIGGVIGGGKRTQRGGWKVESTPRSEQECRSKQKWMGEWKRSGGLRGGQKLLGEQTGEWTYWMNTEGREEGLLDMEK